MVNIDCKYFSYNKTRNIGFIYTFFFNINFEFSLIMNTQTYFDPLQFH